MRMRLKIKVLVLLLVVVSFLSFFDSKAFGAYLQDNETYFIDFDGGNDTNSGISPESPWKHAPGDKNAKPSALINVVLIDAGSRAECLSLSFIT